MAYLALTLLLLLLVIDWRQTLVIARNPGRWIERNPILGDHPPAWRVHVYFTLVIAGVLAVARQLWDMPIAVAVLATVMVLTEAWVVYRNHRLGIRIWT